MNKFLLALQVISLSLAFNTVKSQTFFSAKDLSFNINYGYGKIGYYFMYTPAYISAANNEAVEYSPSYSFKLEKSFWLNDRFDFSIGIGHLTVTEKTIQTAKPPWFDLSDKVLSQSFIHIIPSFRIKLPDDRFTINLGIRMGCAALIGGSEARDSSNSLGEFGADFDSECGASILISNKLFLEMAWIQGLTKYNYSVGTPEPYISFFKYHSFQFGLRYILSNGNKNK